MKENAWYNQIFLFIFLCEKENEPKEIAPCDMALTGCPALLESDGRCGTRYRSDSHSS
jgi:hypothetical protein